MIILISVLILILRSLRPLIHRNIMLSSSASCSKTQIMGHTMEESKLTRNNSLAKTFSSNLRFQRKGWWTGERGIEVRDSSLKSLKLKTGNLIDVNQDVRRIVLKSVNGSLKKSKPVALLNEYFDTCDEMQDLCRNLGSFLKNHSHFSIAEEDDAEIWNEMMNFKEIKDLIVGDFDRLLNSAITHQNLTLQHCQNRSDRLKKKIKHLHRWKKATRVLFLSAVGCVLICTVAAAAVTAPPVLTALAGVAAAPIGSTAKLVDTLWSKHEKVLEGEKNVVGSIETGASLVINDLDSIMATIHELDDEICEMMMNKMESAEEKRAAKIRIIKQLEDVLRLVDQIGNRNDKCREDLEKVKSVILKKWAESPS